LVKDMRIPITVREIIEKPMEEFNDLLTRKDITEEQINICRDIRRRGKNKVRKTKLLSMSHSTIES
jgi:predicted DNA-binding protein